MEFVAQQHGKVSDLRFFRVWEAAARITGGVARSSRPAAARSSDAGIATTTPRIRSTSNCATGTRSLATRSTRSFAPSATRNRMCSRIALTVGPAWANTSVKYATSLMMMFQRSNTIVMDVAYAGKTGGADNFFHCNTCVRAHNSSGVHERDETAPSVSLHSSETSLISSRYGCDDLNEVVGFDLFSFSCPVCSRSACDMTDTWRKLDEEVAATPMPEIYQTKMLTNAVACCFLLQIWILCNDCSATSNVRFHVLGHKCPGCSSYNTKETRGGPPSAACSRV
ncbi:hypothetical protein PR202_ga00402 [Eleusine coracana subsp. coracana]|uniref:RCHY1 zinc-ribbon domain-containing protein n=1 Tax=Eleusine coracana subsp. coracana TaxID=191504 RepID=A0AAV5BG81_ELECO|nr:hypothetical protein PR202_ga00402 [Eleusine coracana subsp. coracana]